MKTFIKNILQPLTSRFRDRKNNYISYKDRLIRRCKNSKLKYSLLTAQEALSHKKSDTIFILGSGPSINDITPEQWDVIRRHDSFGFSFWVVHWFIPTFYTVEYSHYKYLREKYNETFSQKKRNIKYSQSVVFVSSRERQRGAHPLYTPERFPKEPKIFYYPYPDVLSVPNTRRFREGDFEGFSFKLGEKGIIYRGTLSLVIALACQMGYKNIALLGIDLKDSRCFYDNYEEMKWVNRAEKESDKYDPLVWGHPARIHGTMLSKGGKHPISEYIYALNEYCLIPNGINLYVGNPDSLLAERLRVFSWEI